MLRTKGTAAGRAFSMPSKYGGGSGFHLPERTEAYGLNSESHVNPSPHEFLARQVRYPSSIRLAATASTFFLWAFIFFPEA